jgi:hypothetical protein
VLSWRWRQSMPNGALSRRSEPAVIALA